MSPSFQFSHTEAPRQGTSVDLPSSPFTEYTPKILAEAQAEILQEAIPHAVARLRQYLQSGEENESTKAEAGSSQPMVGTETTENQADNYSHINRDQPS